MILVKVFIFEYQNGLETFAPLVKDFDGPSFQTITIIVILITLWLHHWLSSKFSPYVTEKGERSQ